jgi:hypothetical protein
MQCFHYCWIVQVHRCEALLTCALQSKEVVGRVGVRSVSDHWRTVGGIHTSAVAAYIQDIALVERMYNV